MAELRMDLTVRLHARRCGACNRWSAAEDGQPWGCPTCNIKARDEIFDRLTAENTRMARRIFALRGVITRMRRRNV